MTASQRHRRNICISRELSFPAHRTRRRMCLFVDNLMLLQVKSEKGKFEDVGRVALILKACEKRILQYDFVKMEHYREH